MNVCIALLTTADPHTTCDQLAYQMHCIDRTIGNPGPKRMQVLQILSRGADESDPCSWTGVCCRETLIKTIEWGDGHAQIATLSWLPPTLESLVIVNVRLNITLDTQYMPRNIIQYSAPFCALMGYLNMLRLPPKLEELDLSNNNFRGRVNLGNLPDSIRQIDLMDNRIHKVLVDNDLLPKSLCVIRLANRRRNLTIKLVNGETCDSRIQAMNAYIIKVKLMESTGNNEYLDEASEGE